MQIKEIESHLGTPLFNREKKNMYLSPAGEYFLNHARHILQTLNEAEKVIGQLNVDQIEIIKVGIISTAQYFLPQILKMFREEYGEFKIILEVRNKEQLINLLRDGKIDIAVMGLVPKEIDTKIFVIANHPHVFVASANHSLSKLKKIDPQSLNDFDLITREFGSGTRAHMEAFFQGHDIQPNIIMEMSSNESIKQAVIADLGISFMSQHTIASEVKEGCLKILNVKNTPIIRKWHVVTLNPMSLNRSVELLKDFILSQSQTILSKLEN